MLARDPANTVQFCVYVARGAGRIIAAVLGAVSGHPLLAR